MPVLPSAWAVFPDVTGSKLAPLPLSHTDYTWDLKRPWGPGWPAHLVCFLDWKELSQSGTVIYSWGKLAPFHLPSSVSVSTHCFYCLGDLGSSHEPTHTDPASTNVHPPCHQWLQFNTGPAVALHSPHLQAALATLSRELLTSSAAAGVMRITNIPLSSPLLLSRHSR